MGSCTSKQNNESTKSQISIRTNLQSEKDQNKPIEVKVVLLGDQFVGKSSIAQRFCKNVYTGQYVVTIGGAYLQQKIVLNNGTIIKFHFWDTGGQERFRSMANLYYRDASAAVLCYDITNPKSLESLSYWIEELRHKCDQDKLVLCLAGNKSDSDPSERRITTAKAKGKLFY